MKLYLLTEDGEKVELDVDENDIVETIKLKYRYKYKFCPGKGFQQCNIKLYVDDKELSDTDIIKNCSLKENTLIKIRPCYPPSLEEPIFHYTHNSEPIFSRKLTKRLIQSTHYSDIFCKIKDECHSIAAAGCYIKSVNKMYNVKKPQPSLGTCFNIAKCNDDNGNVLTSLRILENHFHYGIQFKEEENLCIKDAIFLTPIVRFSTSSIGWENIKKGNLVSFPGGEDVSQYYALIDGYDLEKNCYICTSAFGQIDENPIYFNFAKEAAHSFIFIVPYFNVGIEIKESDESLIQKMKNYSIIEKLEQSDIPQIIKFKQKVNGHVYNCAWMNKVAAYYRIFSRIPF